MPKIWNPNNSKCWWGGGTTGTLIHCWWECKTLQPPWRQLVVSHKINILLSCKPAVALLGIYPKELKTYVHTETCIWMFTATLFITAKMWKQPRSPSVDEWINKLWYIQTLAHYAALKEMSYQATKKLAHDYMKETNLKKIHTIWFQLYDILTKAKLWSQ